MIRRRPWRLWVLLSLGCVSSAQAHRLHDLLQGSFIEITPSEVRVEVAFDPGLDIAAPFARLVDPDGDGTVSAMESASWSGAFMQAQEVTVDGKSLPLSFHSLQYTPAAPGHGDHPQLFVRYTAALNSVGPGPHRLVCSNRYEPLTSSYQTNGMVPASPSISIQSQQRDESRQQHLTLVFTLTAPAKGGHTSKTPNRPYLPILFSLPVVVAAAWVWRRKSNLQPSSS